MKRLFLRSFPGSALLLVASLIWSSGALPDTAPTGGWPEQYLGGASDVPFYPDGNANYWVYRFNQRAQSTSVGLRIRGQFPSARYMSITVYNDNNFSVLAHIPDLEIKPATGINPFAGVTPSPGAGGTYGIAIVPAGAPTPPDANVVEYDPSIPKISVFLRYYLPEGDTTGGVPLPQLSAFDAATGADLPLPGPPLLLPRAQAAVLNFIEGLLNRQLGKLFATDGPGPLLFSFHTGIDRFYANPDNDYLVIPIVKTADQVAVIRFIPPTTRAQTTEAGTQPDARYWSLELGDNNSLTLYTLADFQSKVNPDGYVYFVLGAPTSELLQKSEALNMNFIPWSLGDRGVLIYRNLLANPGFSGNLALVPLFNAVRRWRPQVAQRFIGDYAPTGKLLSVHDFLALP